MMRLMRFLIALLAFSAGSATAQDWAVRGADRLLTKPEVERLTAGRTLVFYDDGRSKFSVGGAYSYTYAQGGTAYGYFEIKENGTICISFRNGFARCDRYVEASGRIVMLTSKGERFPVRPP